MVEGSRVRGSNSLNPLQLLAGRKQEVCVCVGGHCPSLFKNLTTGDHLECASQETSGTLVSGEGGWTLSERPCSPTMQIFCGHLGGLWFVLRTESLVQTGEFTRQYENVSEDVSFKENEMSFNMDGRKMGWS